MPLTTVNPNSTDIEHLASVDVEFSGTHIGGGIYLATNHDPNTDGRVRTWANKLSNQTGKSYSPKV